MGAWSAGAAATCNAAVLSNLAGDTLDRVRALMRVDCEFLDTRTGRAFEARKTPSPGAARSKWDRPPMNRRRPEVYADAAGWENNPDLAYGVAL